MTLPRVLLAFGLLMAAVAQAQTWNLATSTHATTGDAIVFRFLDQFADGFDKATQPQRIIITWRYDGTRGQPSREERTRMDALEDALMPAVEKDGFATLALVSTGDNLREWIWYAKSEAEFFHRLNRALGRLKRFPIDIHSAPDPEWKSYQDFKTGLAASPEGGRKN